MQNAEQHTNFENEYPQNIQVARNKHNDGKYDVEMDERIELKMFVRAFNLSKMLLFAVCARVQFSSLGVHFYV